MRKGLVLAGVMSSLLFIGTEHVEARGGSRGPQPRGGSASPRSSGHSKAGPSIRVPSSEDHGSRFSSRSFSAPRSEAPVFRGASGPQGATSSRFRSSGQSRRQPIQIEHDGGAQTSPYVGSSAQARFSPSHRVPASGGTTGSVRASEPGNTNLGSAGEFFRRGRSPEQRQDSLNWLSQVNRRQVRAGSADSPIVSRGVTPRSSGEDSGAARVGSTVFGHASTRRGGARQDAAMGGASPVAGGGAATSRAAATSGVVTSGFGKRQPRVEAQGEGRTGAVTALQPGGRGRLPSVFGDSSGQRVASRQGTVNTRVIGGDPGHAVSGGRVNVRDYSRGHARGGYRGDGHHHGWHHGHGSHHFGYGHHVHHHHHGWHDTWWGFGLGFSLGVAATWPGYYWCWGNPYAYYNTWYGGPCFGYGVSYYEPVYTTYFVEAAPYCPPTEVIIEQPVVVAPPAAQQEPAPQVQPPAAQGGFPAPQPAGPQAAPQDGGQPPAMHVDFDPGVKAFLAGNYAMAEARFLRVTADEPDNGEAWLGLTQARLARGDYGAAADALDKAAELGAFPRGYRFDPRPLYPQTGSYERVVAALDAHLKVNPKDADAWLVRAYLHVALAERAPAREAIDKVLALRPDDMTAPDLALALLPALPPPQKASESGAAGLPPPAVK